MKSFRKLVTSLVGAAAIVAALPALVLADPLTVTFPTLGVEAQTEWLGVDAGQLGVPVDPDSLGMYQLDGNLLLVGHLDWAGQRRVLAAVRAFQPGAPIWLSDGRTYHVAWSKTLPIDGDQSEWTDAVAAADDVLTLVTCTGPFSQSRHEYLERSVIRAVRDD
jgi:hypothetical protein